MTLIRNTPYMDHFDSFMGDMNEAQTRARMAKIDAENLDRQNLSASGFYGTVAGTAAGLFDPMVLIPVVGEAEKGAGLVKGVIGGVKAGATFALPTELAMQASQQTRTTRESVENVASNVILMGVLGGALGRLTHGEAKVADSDLDKVRRDFSGAQTVDMADHDASPPPPGAGGALALRTSEGDVIPPAKALEASANREGATIEGAAAPTRESASAPRAEGEGAAAKLPSEGEVQPSRYTEGRQSSRGLSVGDMGAEGEPGRGFADEEIAEPDRSIRSTEPRTVAHVADHGAYDASATSGEGERVGEITPAGFEESGAASPEPREDRAGVIPDHVFTGDADRSLSTIFRSEHYDGSHVSLHNAGLTEDEIKAMHDAGFADHEGAMSAGQFVAYDRERAARGYPEREIPSVALHAEIPREVAPVANAVGKILSDLPEKIRVSVRLAMAGDADARVSLSDLRDAFKDIPKADFDRVIAALHGTEGFSLSPAADARRLTKAQRAATLEHEGSKMAFAHQTPRDIGGAIHETLDEVIAAARASQDPIDRQVGDLVEHEIAPLVDEAFPKNEAPTKPLDEKVRSETLLAFLKRLGGIKDFGGELKARNLHRTYPGLVNNKRGMTLDDARQAAAEQGYLGDDIQHAVANTRVADLLDALTEHPRYSVHGHDEIERARNAKAFNDEQRGLASARERISGYLAEVGMTADREHLAHAAEIFHRERMSMATLGESDESLMEYALEQPARDMVGRDAEQAATHRETNEFPEIDHEAATLDAPTRRQGDEGPYFGDRPGTEGDAGTARAEVRPAGEAGAGEERNAARAHQALSEPGPEGSKQILMPGLDPVTDADRMKVRQGKKMRGGNAAPPEGGLFDTDARLQRDLTDIGASDGDKVSAMMEADAGRPPSGLAQSGGAAAADTRQLKLKNYGVPEWLKGIPYAGPGAEAVGGVLNKFSPMLRNFTSRSVQLRRATADLAETPLMFEENAKGVTTSYGGPPLDRLIKTQQRQFQIAANDHFTEQFIKYRYGDAPPKFPMEQSGVEDVAGRANGKMSFSQFKAEVHRATYSGDKHAIPEVAAAAKAWRRDVADPVAKMAQETKGPDGRPMLAEELSPGPDESYGPRVWNKEALGAKRNEARDLFTNYLVADQATKAAAKDRLIDLQKKHDGLVATQARIDQRIATVDRRLAEVGPALKERGMETNRATDREDTVQGRVAAMDEDLEEMRQALAETRQAFVGTNVAPEERAAYDSLRRDMATLQRRRDRGGARLDEAGVPVNASQSRFMDLADRQTRYQTMKDILTTARENAETERLATRAGMEDEIRKWQGNSAAEAQGALKGRDEAERVRGLKQQAGVYQGKGARLTSADAAIDSAVDKIVKSPRDLSRMELVSRADEIIDRLLGSPDGRLSYDSEPTVGPPSFGGGQEVRGSLRSREFMIPSAIVHDFIEHDMQHLTSTYLRSILPDVHLTRRFGDIEMRDSFRKINDEYAAMAAGMTSEKDLIALEKERQGGIRDLAAIRDRLRGVYGWTPDPRMRQAARIAGIARNWNMVADLGTSVANRLGDAGANAVFRHGFMNVMRDSWYPMFKAMTGNPTLAKAYREQAMAMAVGTDGILGHMGHDFGDAMENYRPGSKFERGLAWAADKSMLVNMHGPWTDWTKTMISGVASAEMLRAAERVALGSATSKDIERLAAANIDRAMANKIWENFSNGGGSHIEGTPVPNTRAWADLEARTHFEAAIGREADIAVITPGMEKPLWMSGPIAGLIGQFKSFVAGSYERLLIANLQQRDARTVQGVLTALATGMVSYRLYTWLSGKEASDNPADWIKEAVHRSAILSWFSEINEMQAKFSGGSTDMYRAIGATSPLTRRDQSPAGALLGPTYSRVEGLLGATGDALRAMLAHTVGGDPQKVIWTAQDTHKLREVMLLQNLAGFRILLDQVENGINDALGVPHRDKSNKTWNPRSSFNAIQESTPPEAAPPQ